MIGTPCLFNPLAATHAFAFWRRIYSSSLVICACVCVLLVACSEPSEPTVGVTPVHVIVCCDSAPTTMTLSGTLVPRVESQLAFRVPGRVVQRLVDMGENVVQGQVLMRLDDTPLKLVVQEAVADLAQAQALLAQVRRDVQRNRPLAQAGAIAGAAFDALQTQQTQLQEQVQAARSRLNRARHDLTYTTLTAPSDGTIALVQADAGQVLAVGTPVLRLARSHEAEIQIDVPESYIGQIAQDQTAKVRLLSLPDVVLTASVREIASVADAQTRTYRVRLSLPERPRAARLGMSASVQFVSASPDTALQLPITALFQHGDQAAVWVLPEGAHHVQLRPVTLAAMGINSITLAAGVTPGERVVIAGVHRLDANMPVQAWDGRLP